MTPSLCLIAFSLALVTPGKEPPSGINLMINAVRWQGLNPTLVRTGYAEVEMIAKGAPPPQDSVRKEAEALAETMRKAYTNVTDKEARARMEQVVRDLPYTLAKKNVRHSRFRILFDGNDYSGRRKFIVANFNHATGQWDKAEALRRNAGKQGGENVMWLPSGRLATISNWNVGLPEFQEFGRLCGPASKILTAALLQGSDPAEFNFSSENIELLKKQVLEASHKTGANLYELAGEVEYEDGAVAYVVQNRVNNRIVQQYWIDASRGYICPLIQYFDYSGRVSTEWKSSNYFLHSETGLWFPEKHVYTQYRQDSNTIAEQIEYTINKDTLKLNQPISIEEFSIEIPANAHILDTRPEQHERYRTKEAITLSFVEGGLDLRDKAIVPVTAQSGSKWPSGFLRSKMSWVFIVNIVAILVITSLLVARRYRAFGLILSVICFCGCSGTTLSPERDTEHSAKSSASACRCGLAIPQPDIWWDEPIRIDESCHGRLDIHTLRYPDVEFDVSNLQPGIIVQEIARRTISGQTTISFTVLINASRPSEIVLTPMEKNGEPLIVPVRYPHHERSFGQGSIWPERIALGIISSNEMKTFVIHGEPKVLSSMAVAGHTGLPPGLTIFLGASDAGKRLVELHSANNLQKGLFDGKLLLRSTDGREFAIQLMGMAK